MKIDPDYLHRQEWIVSETRRKCRSIADADEGYNASDPSRG